MKAGPISNVVCPDCKRSLDDVIESLIRQRGKFKGQREQARAERDRYRNALENIARLEHVNAADAAVNAAGRDAREALDG